MTYMKKIALLLGGVLCACLIAWHAHPYVHALQFLTGCADVTVVRIYTSDASSFTLNEYYSDSRKSGYSPYSAVLYDRYGNWYAFMDMNDFNQYERLALDVGFDGVAPVLFFPKCTPEQKRDYRPKIYAEEWDGVFLSHTVDCERFIQNVNTPPFYDQEGDDLSLTPAQ